MQQTWVLLSLGIPCPLGCSVVLLLEHDTSGLFHEWWKKKKNKIKRLRSSHQKMMEVQTALVQAMMTYPWRNGLTDHFGSLFIMLEG